MIMTKKKTTKAAPKPEPLSELMELKALSESPSPSPAKLRRHLARFLYEWERDK